MKPSKKKGGVVAPTGFQAAAAACGLKPNGALDLAIVASACPATSAGAFTTNKVCAAPVKVTRKRVKRGKVRAVVINAGNANACTGPQGLADAQAMTAATAKLLGVPEAEVGVASTGVIGRPMDMTKVLAGIAAAGPTLKRTQAAGDAASRAIMTTDTVPKSCAYAAKVGGRTVTVGGMTKGAGMIAPNMLHATMLCFLTTDAAVEAGCLQALLDDAVDATFNCITIDGDTSTNDTVLLFANGAAGGDVITRGTPEAAALGELVLAVCDDLARRMVKDGEGATTFIEVQVRGAANAKDARLAARAIAHSPLVKTAVYGRDPNWGRIAAAAGYSGARMKEDALRIAIGGVKVVEGGVPVRAAVKALQKAMHCKELLIEVDLGVGDAAAHVYTCDLTHEYVNINAHYTT